MALPIIAELSRRRVFRALIVYGVIAFAILQIIEPVMHGLHWPDDVLSYVVVALAVGFPLVVGFAWVFDLNSGRVERSASPPAAHGLRGAPLVLLLLAIGVLAATPGVLYYFVVRAGARGPGAIGNKGGPANPSIAVLPFADMSPQRDQEYFSDGLADEILNSLAEVQGLDVAGRTSSFSFKGKNEDVRTIGQKLNVAHVLEGSVRRDGPHVRITAQLIKSSDGYHLWSKTFDREMTGIFAIQDEIARSVVEALKVKLMPVADAARSEHGTTNLEAYNQYLLGQQFFRHGSDSGTRRAIHAYEKALAIDPGYAPAWAGLAIARDYFSGLFADSVAVVVENEQGGLGAAEKAIALDANLAEGYQARGRIRSGYNWDWRGGESDLKRALALKPSQPAILSDYAALLNSLARFPEAIAIARRATELDPLRPEAWGTLSSLYRNTNQFDLARSASNRALEIAPDHAPATCALGMIALLEGKASAALESYGNCRLEYLRLMGVAVAHHERGERQKSQEALDRLINEMSQTAAYQIAEVYGCRGETDAALDWLDRAYAQHDGGLEAVKRDHCLRKLRREPRYAALLKRMNLPPD